MNYIPKTAHWRTQWWKCGQDNQSIFQKSTCPTCWVKRIRVCSGQKKFQYTPVPLCSHQLTKYKEVCEWNIQKFYIRETRCGGRSTHWRICEHKYSGEVQPHPQNFTSILRLYVTTYEKNVQGQKWMLSFQQYTY